MTQGRKFDTGKPEFSLLPPWALEAVAKVMTFGAQKYAVDNWKIVPNGEYRYKNAAGRHINEYLKGNLIDPETGEHHLAHAICCLMFILDAYESQMPLAGEPSNVLPGTNHTTGPVFGTVDPGSYFTNNTPKKGAELSGIAYMTRRNMDQADPHTNARTTFNPIQN